MDKNNNLIDFIPSKLIKTYSLQDDDVEVIPSIEKKYKLKHNKTKSRAIVIQSLYESDVSGKNPLDILKRNYQGKKLDKENTDFMELLVKNFIDKKHMINDKINSKLLNKNSVLFPIDKCIIQLAIVESISTKSLNKKIIINEAVELAKYFGEDSSSKFVNGILSSLI
ncbi:MAG: transcription antitermination factor NusB [Chloroflexi bacterium]|nr:transcription antitermination factor NusB [Chloroflexota bacterium]|tara:strand:+ start:1462 stop:1965 length:504 start_codon:yes stop_codon:yes gene_type:complete